MSTTHIINPPKLSPIRVTVSDDTYVPRESDADNWEHRAYVVTITYQGRSMRVGYRCGMLIPAGRVDPLEVLTAITYDAGSVIDAAGFKDWCGDMGYDIDDPRARAIYRACENTRARIARVFKGDAARFLQYAADAS